MSSLILIGVQGWRHFQNAVRMRKVTKNTKLCDYFQLSAVVASEGEKSCWTTIKLNTEALFFSYRLIATMLGRLRMSTGEVLTAYADIANVYSKKSVARMDYSTRTPWQTR